MITHDRQPGTYLFTGGGTGGHVYPGLAIADEVRNRNPNARIEYIGARGKIEETLVPERGYPIHLVHARGLPTQKNIGSMLVFALHTGLGFLESLVLLLRIRPQIVVATGGYASSPVLMALAALRFLRLLPTFCFIHEQNVVPGLVNRLAGHIADRIGVSFGETTRYFPSSKVVRVGYPIRKEIGTVTRDDARSALNIPSGAQVVFAVGGSSGARSINRALVDALPRLMERDNLHVFHVIGSQQNPEYHAAHDTSARLAETGLDPAAIPQYHQMDYTHTIETMYAASDIVIARSGAATVTEICACGQPSILIPLPNVSGDHQALNARTLETAGAAQVLYEEAMLDRNRIIGVVNGQRLADLILTLLDDPERRMAMAESARNLFDRHGLDRIMIQLGLASEHNETVPFEYDEDANRPGHDDAAFAEIEAVTRLSPFMLLKRVEQANRQYIQTIGIDYLNYKVNGYLTSERWQIRNVGVKLVGLLEYRDKLPQLLAMLQDRTPTPWPQRLFGGDYQQVGFIRRNIIRTIVQLGVYNTDVRNALLASFDDPYYEVRLTAAQAITELAHSACPDDEVMGRLYRLIQDASFDVVAAAITALGKVGDASIIQTLRKFYLDTNWKIREAIIHALIELIHRDVITDYEALVKETDDILVTCVDFQPTFPIKRTLNELITLINQRR